MVGFFEGNIIGAIGSGPIGIPVVPLEEGSGDTKLFHDRYEVFVNGDKVGEKTLLTQGEDAQDLEPYLKDNGFKNFDYEVTGDHIEIKVKEDSHQMKEILSSYLSIK